jgi:aminopeptidase N
VDVDVSGDQDVFGSVTTARFRCREPGSSSFIEIMPARLRRVVLNGQDLDPGTLRGNRLPLPGLRDVNELRVEADIPYSRGGEGLYRFTDPADGETYLAVHAGLDSAQRVFAAFDQPDLKAVITATVVAPESWTVLGNGVARPAGLDPGPAGSPGSPGRARWSLAATPPISSYLFTLVAGPYHSISSEHRGIPFGLHARRSLAGLLDRDAEEILAVTRACFDRYRDIFAEPYPYDSYDQAFVPELEAGAVENPGCITFRDEFLFPSAGTWAERQRRGMVVAHEMAHMWFGDLVTMAWWNDVWLSESFATYMGFQVLSDATAFTGAWTDFALDIKSRGYDADQRASTHPVAPGPHEVPDTDAARSSYDDISYAKGASALRQLVAWTGWPAFIAGINDYLTRYRFGSATLDDLLDCLTRASGADVHDWAARWLRTPGVDTLALRPSLVTHAGSSPPKPVTHAGGSPPELVTHADRRPPELVTHAGRRPHQVRIGAYDRVPGDGELVLRARFPVSVAADAREVALPSAAIEPAPALLLPNDGDFSYCKVRLDPRSWATLSSGLGRLADPLSRAVAWNAARDLVRDGELPAREYLDLAAGQLPAETDTTIAGPVLAFARWTIADRYLPRPQRDAALAGLAEVCRALLGVGADGMRLDRKAGPDGTRLDRDAGPDADGMRLVAGRGLIDSASRPDEIATLRAWLRTGAWPGGPELDSRVRWQIMLRLTVLGALSRPDIGREAARDATDAGQQSAARCRAALPDPDAKEAAWAEMFGAGGSSGYLLAATAEGFWQADQADLVAGYVPRYFPAIADVSARRAPAARILVRHGFPRHAVTAATLHAGEECLAAAAFPTSLRRLLADQLDDLRRALQIRSGPVVTP